MHTLILGAGYSGIRIARHALQFGSVCGTRREQSGLDELLALGIPGCRLNHRLTPEFCDELACATHLIVSVAPARTQPLHDPMLSLIGQLAAAAMPDLQWVGYLSTIGVYGDHGGDWVDEQTPCSSTQLRSILRREAEIAWQEFGNRLQLPVSILRLSGIYGPGRNAVEDALAGSSRIILKPGQVFNRIHVDDIAAATVKAATLKHSGILNITDDQPAPPQDVVRFACQLIARKPPEPVDFATADISSMARSFYSENKRVRNDASKAQLGFAYRYPDYKSALESIWTMKQAGRTEFDAHEPL